MMARKWVISEEESDFSRILMESTLSAFHPLGPPIDLEKLHLSSLSLYLSPPLSPSHSLSPSLPPHHLSAYCHLTSVTAVGSRSPLSTPITVQRLTSRPTPITVRRLTSRRTDNGGPARPSCSHLSDLISCVYNVMVLAAGFVIHR